METKRMFCRIALPITALFVSLAIASAAPRATGKHVVASGRNIAVEFDDHLRSRVIAKLHGEIALGAFHESEFLGIKGVKQNAIVLKRNTVRDWEDSLGKGKVFEIVGESNVLRKTMSIVSYDAFPSMLLFNVVYQNIGKDSLTVERWTNNNYALTPHREKGDSVSFWSYQPGSYGWDNNWIMPLTPGYARENYLGMNAVEYGGGTPVVDIWTRECGIAVGHVETVPKLVSMPVHMSAANEATLGITYAKNAVLPPTRELSTFRTFVAVHNGDHFNSLTVYRRFMERQGFTFKDAPEDAHQSEWCTWGYEEHYTMEQIYKTLPKAKEVGLDWVVLDMGWYNAIGDFTLNPTRFPNGEQDIKRFVDSVHSYGMKVQLWWMPYAAMLKTDVMAKHPDYLLLNKDGSPQFMPMFFKTFFLCPASKDVQEFSRQQITRLMRWGIDGLKIDGDNQNCVPACFNPDHHHASPDDALEALPAFFKMVYETALSVNPNAKIEVCPCGTNQSFFLMPYMNETVASDPHNSWQIRLKAKTLRALTGPKAVFYGDHVELSDAKSDFASTVGVGGVIGTKFVYPPGVYMNTESGDVSLTPEKEVIWKKWVQITKDHVLSKGTYRGELYDLGFDRPEAHAIQKGDAMYYAFYAPRFHGRVELRGLDNKAYRIIDYENNVDLGVVRGPVHSINVSFSKHLLVKAEPQ